MRRHDSVPYHNQIIRKLTYKRRHLHKKHKEFITMLSPKTKQKCIALDRTHFCRGNSAHLYALFFFLLLLLLMKKKKHQTNQEVTLVQAKTDRNVKQVLNTYSMEENFIDFLLDYSTVFNRNRTV